jgi:putative transposase
MQRRTPFVNEEYYHVYNRGVDKRETFSDEEDYKRFLLGIKEFNRIDPIGSLYEKHLREKKRQGLSPHYGDLVPTIPTVIVEIIAYCLNPNHFHLILKQVSDDGISKFMLKLGSGYTTYYNMKNDRSGSLFQGPFKSSHIDSNEYLLYVSAYVNCNSEVHKIAKAEDYEWCSFPEYIGKSKNNLCNKNIILGQFKDLKEYYNYAKINAQEMKFKKEAEKMMLE